MSGSVGIGPWRLIRGTTIDDESPYTPTLERLLSGRSSLFGIRGKAYAVQAAGTAKAQGVIGKAEI